VGFPAEVVLVYNRSMRNGSLPHLLAGVGLALALVAPPRAALAQPSPETRAAATALFEDARRLMADGKYTEACPKLEESQRIDPGAGTLFNLALCYEAQNRTASAWVSFRDVAQMALTAGQADREKLARGKAAALEPKLMKLKITAQPGAAGVEVKRDGAVVSPALLGTPVSLDPGKHVLSATAPGKEPWEVTIQLDQPGATVTVDVPPLLDRKAPGATAAPPPPRGAAAPPPGGAAPPPPPPPSDLPSPRPWQRPLGIAGLVVGAGGLGAGIGVGLLAKSSYNQSNQNGQCSATTNKCADSTGLNLRSDAVTKGNIATGVFFAGAAFAVAGIVLVATAPSSRQPTTGAASFELGVGPGSVGVSGAF
jgi:serine/threonine-protein kinase